MFYQRNPVRSKLIKQKTTRDGVGEDTPEVIEIATYRFLKMLADDTPWPVGGLDTRRWISDQKNEDAIMNGGLRYGYYASRLDDGAQVYHGQLHKIATEYTLFDNRVIGHIRIARDGRRVYRSGHDCNQYRSAPEPCCYCGAFGDLWKDPR